MVSSRDPLGFQQPHLPPPPRANRHPRDRPHIASAGNCLRIAPRSCSGAPSSTDSVGFKDGSLNFDLLLDQVNPCACILPGLLSMMPNGSILTSARSAAAGDATVSAMVLLPAPPRPSDPLPRSGSVNVGRSNALGLGGHEARRAPLSAQRRHNNRPDETDWARGRPRAAAGERSGRPRRSRLLPPNLLATRLAVTKRAQDKRFDLPPAVGLVGHAAPSAQLSA